ncbi:hypothetical protein HW571_24665 [Agrobacterium genomosp. 3]|uniref:hypothetical protein n=1 Tax=Agrobacterium tomkonis TaxID=1183410 RepID=UPI001CD859DD|nr:hypothetical protein [Agrobacterium tomkonis]MCA1879254.1 hypothetical protein [Agrobacterium tumefaciens]MCA1894417.1 hypothetical protein [Agrobacterium tomkonis]
MAMKPSCTTQWDTIRDACFVALILKTGDESGLRSVVWKGWPNFRAIMFTIETLSLDRGD